MARKKRKNYISSALDFVKFDKQMEECKFNIQQSSFYCKLLSSIEKSVKSLNMGKITQFVCYGLGNFSSSVISRYQLALLLLLKDHIKTDVDIYDPIFTSLELEFLGKLNLRLIEKNEEGLRKIESLTFLYMPHCPFALINNLLWSNWQPKLSNCILLTNSFSLLTETVTKVDLKTKFECIHNILPVICELFVDNNFKYEDIFNDLSLLFFCPDVLEKLPSSFWENIQQPKYDDNEIECISNKLLDISIKKN